MIGREPSHPSYVAETFNVLGEVLPDEEARTAVMAENARRYLDLDGDTAVRRRLREFFDENHLFSEIFQ